jgi:hypothetical protein
MVWDLGCRLHASVEERGDCGRRALGSAPVRGLLAVGVAGARVRPSCQQRTHLDAPVSGVGVWGSGYRVKGLGSRI